METGVVIVQEPVSATISEGANEYLVSKQADETVKYDDIEGPPGVVDRSIKAHEAKVVPDISIGHSGSNGVTIGSADPAEVPNGSGNKENEGAEEEKATHDNPIAETTDITKEKSIAAENFDVALDRQASDFVEASSVRNEETRVHDPGMVSIVETESLNRDDHGDIGKAQPVETISTINDSERTLDDATVDSKTEDEITRKIQEIHESSKVIEEAVSTEKHTAQQQLHSIESCSPVHEETMVESSEALMDAPPATANTKEEMVRSCKKIEIEENSNQAHEESQRSSTDKDIEEHVPEENVPKDETTVTQSEAVDTTTAEEEKISKNAETILDASEAVHTTKAEEEEIARDTKLLDEGENTKEGPLGSEVNLTKEEMLQREDEETTEAAEQKIPRNAEAIVTETEAADTITEQEKISKDAETILEVTEAVNTSASEEEKIAKEFPDEEETTKDGHLGPQENLTEETKNDKLQKEGEDTTENETEAVQTTIAAEEEIRKNDDTILKESGAADTTTEEEEGISKNAETKLEANVNIHTTDATEEKISKDAEILDEGETTKGGHPEPQENLAEETLQKECGETVANETKALQITAVVEEEIPKNIETIVNETTMVVPTAVEEEQISGNADTILDDTESVHATTAAEEKIAKDAELLDEDETTKEGHLRQEENLIEEDRKEMLHKEGEETVQNETQSVQTTAVAEEDILKNDNTIINEPEAADNSTAEEERICKNAEMTLEATEAVLTTDAAEEKASKDVELLDEGETTKGCLPEPEDNVTKEEMLQKEGGETTADDTEAVQTAAASEEEIPRNVKTVVNETEAIDPAETEEERISDNVEPILDTIEAVQSRTAAEEKTTKDDELLDEGETTKDGHLGQEENLTEKEMLQKEGGEIIAGPPVVKKKAATHSPLESKEVEERALEERSMDDPSPLQEESCLPKEQIDETHSQEEQTEKHESSNEAIPDDQQAITEEKSDEHIRIPLTEPRKLLRQLKHAETIVDETGAMDATKREEETISKDAETIVEATEAVCITKASEGKLLKDTELLDQGETTDGGHPEPEENKTKEEMLQKEGGETLADETEAVAVQTTAESKEEILSNVETIAYETESVDATTAEEERISSNAEPILDASEAVHTTTTAEEKIAKDAELLDEGETTKEVHLEQEENLTEEDRTEMLRKEDDETIANETEALQTTGTAKEEIQKNAHTAVNETEAVVTGTAEEEILKNADPDVDAIDTGPTTVPAEEKLLKDTELLDEGETAKKVNLKPEEIPTGDSMLHKEDEDTKELKTGEDEAIKTVILSEEVPQKIDREDDVEYIKDKITAKETGAHEVDDEVKSSDQKNVQTAESGEHMEPSSSGIKIDEPLPEKSSTNPEEKILQEDEPEAAQVTKKEGQKLEESPSGILLKVGTEDHGSEDKEKLTEDSLKIDEVDETNITSEVFIPSGDQVAEESGESQIAKEQRGWTPGDLEAEKNDQNKTRTGASDETKDQETTKTDEMMKGPLENPVAVESVGLGETTHDQNLPEVESIEKMEECPELPSVGLKQTTETVDEKIEEQPEEAGHLDQEGQEEGPPVVKKKAATHSPLESKEVEERALEERSMDDPSPLQEESCLPKEQIDETHSQEEQTEKHESSNEAIPDDQQAITEEKSDEHIRIPLVLPSEEQEQGSLAEPERVEDEKVKDTESASDRTQEAIETTETPELSSVPCLPAEKSEADETPSSELISGLDEQTPKQVEEIIEEEKKEADELEAEKVPSSEDIFQEISEKEAPISASVAKEEEQVTASDDVTIQGAKGEKEIAEMNESQEEVLNSTETKEPVFPEEEQHGDPEPSKNDERLNVQIRMQEQLQVLPSDESKIITTDASESIQDKPKEDEERPQVLEPLSKDTGVADRGLPLEQSSMPNADAKVSDEQIQIPSDVGDNETLEGSDLSKVTEVTVDERFLEENSDEQVKSKMKFKQETPTEETEEGDKEIKETERTEALEGSGTSETLEIRQEEPKDHEAPNLEDKEEDKNQKVPETTEEQEAQADHCLPIETSEPDQTPSTELVLGGDEQTPKQVNEINEAKTKEADELQLEEIPRGEIIPVESSDDKGPTSVLLASGEAEQVTASDAVTMQESKSEDEVTKMNKGKVEVPAAVETEDMILDTKTKDLEDEAKEKLEHYHVEEGSDTPADQSHIEEKSDYQVEELPQELSSEKQVLEPSTEATPVEDEDVTKMNSGVTETVEGQSMSNTSEDACLNQEETKDHGAPKQCGITEDQTLPKSESPDDTSFLNKTGEVEHEDGLTSALPTAQTENVFQTTLGTESDTRDAPALGETMTMEPAEEAQQAGDDEVESKEKDFETSIKLEDSETEEKHPVTEITGLETGEKPDMKEEEGVTAAEKQEICVEEQSVPANELNLLNKPTEELEVQEEQIRELEARVEEKIQEEETRETVEREETIPATGRSGEKIQIPSSALAFEEPEHAISTEKQEDKSEESSLPKNESHADSTPGVTDTFSDQNMPEETPDETLQTQSTNMSTEKLVRETQAEVKNDERKEEEESVAQAQHDANAAAVGKASLQEEPPKDPKASEKVEEPEHAISTEKQEDKSEESSLPKNESHEDFTPDTFSDQNMPEEIPDEKLQPQSANTSTEKLVRETQAEVKKVHDGERKEEEESVAQGQHDANAAAVEKASLQEEPPKDPKASEKVGDTFDQIIEAQEPAVVPETRSSASLSQETEQKPDSPEPAEGENVAIIEGKKNEDIQEEKPEDTSATMQKEEAFSPKVKTDIGDATERGTHHALTSLEVEKEEPQSALRNEEEINGAVPTEKQIIQSPEELREKADGIEFESNEETAELQARSEDTMSDEKHHDLAADSGITGEQGGEGTKEISVAEAKNEEWSLQEQTKETNIYTAEKSTNNLVFSMEQAPKDQIEEVKMQEEKPRELEAQIEEILTDQPLVKDAQIEQEEPSAKEQRKEPSLSEEEEEKGPQDIKHEVECSLNSQTAEVVEEPQQLSSTLASEDNKHQNLESATEVEEKAKEDSENLEEKSSSEAFVVNLTESTIQSKEATPKDGPTVAPDDVMKIQAPEMIERDEILQEIAGEEKNISSEKSDQISLQEVTNQIHKENKQAGFATVVTGDIPKEENLSGQKEDISTEKNIDEPMLLPESLPAKADKVLAEKETAQENLNDTKDTDEETREIKPEVQKIESVSSESLPQGASSKIEEQETEISPKGDCLSQPKEITEEFQKLEKSIPLILDKEIPVEATLSQQKTVEDLQKNEREADGAGNIKGTSSEIKGTEHVESKIDNLDEKITESPTSIESGRNSLSDLLQKVKKGKETKTGEEGTRVEEAKTDKVEDTEASHIEEAKTEENKDDEGDGDEHKEDKTSPDSVVMVEARDVNDKTPHKKSHGILSGVGSKVKHSISKVKKAITGKSSHTKPVSPK
ncbi:PREDICTED: LOW QUALITY PROTEIN: titin [Tarenaya hassleriana]|uniref:LOW QUALITY PROTEIN: titin n=1 Tax=Tarenaya hassleriana TaxID=28532 RepID=UPI00053C2448|nr:PREDICTED: LOW QUALITY PROTEIN: titin [Tarenaya hassleriana]